MSAPHVARVVETVRALARLTSLTDSHLTPQGLRARRRADLAAIRDRLAKGAPAEVAPPDRGPALAALAAKTADDLAFQDHDWTKVRALVDSGRSLLEVIATADTLRLAAILDHLETAPEVLGDSRPEEVADALRAAVWDRLVEVDATAGRIAAAERAVAVPNAWRAAYLALIETGSLTYEARALLHAAGEEGSLDLIDRGVAEAVTATTEGQIVRLVESLDSPDLAGVDA